MGLIRKYWQWIVSTNAEESVKLCYEWPKRNMIAKSRAKELKRSWTVLD
jgi:hypothetical protein